MKDIKLNCRYHGYHTLQHLEGKTYKLILHDEDGYVRIIYNNDGGIYAIDPDRGPFMAVGGKIEDMNIRKIYIDNGFKIEFE